MKKAFIILLFILLIGAILFLYFPEKKLPGDLRIEKITVDKSERKMSVWSDGHVIKSYTISLGKNPRGHKQFEGDHKTPEGNYFIDSKNPHSTCFMNLGISYPNKSDRMNAKKLGKKPGGDIKIHGLLNGNGWIGKFHRYEDWTLGCIAVTNEEMKELYDHVDVGTPIEIRW